MNNEIARACRTIARWANEEPRKGWRLYGARLEAVRKLRLSGCSWEIRHALHAFSDKFPSIITVKPRAPLSVRDERRLREDRTFRRIDGVMTRLGYSGGWVLDPGIEGRWSFELDEKFTPKAEMQVFREFTFPTERTQLWAMQRRTSYRSLKPLSRSTFKRLLYEALDSSTVRKSISHEPVFAGCQLNREERLGDCIFSIGSTILISGEPNGAFEYGFLISTRSQTPDQKTMMRVIQRGLRALGFRGGLHKSPVGLSAYFSKTGATIKPELSRARRELDAIRFASLPLRSRGSP